MKNYILQKITENVNNSKKAALITLTDSTGSSPGKAGSIMAVLETGECFGTVGGGKIEHELITRTKLAIEQNENFEFNYELTGNGELGMVCGGVVKGYVNIFYPNKTLVLFGAGHISQQIAKLAANLDFDISVVDDRDEFASKFENVNYLTSSPLAAIEKINFNKNTYIVIATRGHSMDAQALKAVINLDTSYIGMVGSRKKIIELRESFLQEGVDIINKVYAPIGLDIANETPEEIAFSILSEILLIKNGKKLQHMKDRL